MGKSFAECLLLHSYFFEIQSLVQFFHILSCQPGTEQGRISEQLLEVTITHEERTQEKGCENLEIPLEFGSSKYNQPNFAV